MSEQTSDQHITTAAELPEADTPASDTVKDPADWVTGDEPATGAQHSYLETLAREAGREVPDDITKADASQLIDDLRQQSSRVQDA